MRESVPGSRLVFNALSPPAAGPPAANRWTGLVVLIVVNVQLLDVDDINTHPAKPPIRSPCQHRVSRGPARNTIISPLFASLSLRDTQLWTRLPFPHVVGAPGRGWRWPLGSGTCVARL